MSRRREETRVGGVPEIVFDAATCKRYAKGRFLGKVRNRRCCDQALSSSTRSERQTLAIESEQVDHSQGDITCMENL